MRSEVVIKQGGTLCLTLQFLNDDGTLADISAAQLGCQVRDALGNLVATLALVPAEEPSIVVINENGTAGWPAGVLRCDVKVTVGSEVDYSQTFAIRVEKAVTQ